MVERAQKVFARFALTSIFSLFTSKLWNGRRRFDLSARFSFTSILMIFTSKWWNRPQQRDFHLLLTSIFTFFTRKWRNWRRRLDRLARFSVRSFCLFKYARAVKRKVWNESENSERDWGETLFFSRLTRPTGM